MAIPSPDTIVHTFTPEGTAVPSGLTSDQIAARKLGQEKRRIYEATKDTDPTAGLKRVKGAEELSRIDTSAEIGRRLRPETEITEPADDPAELAKRQTEQKTLSDATLKSAAEAKTIAEKGLDGIMDATGNPDIARQNEIVDALVKSVLDVRPKFAALDIEEKRAQIRDLLQNPAARTAIAPALAKLLDPNADIATSEVPLKNARETYRLAKKEASRAKNELGNLKNEVTDLENAVVSHQPGGTNALRITSLESQSLPTQIATLRSIIEPGLNPTDLARVKNEVRIKMKAGTAITDPTEQIVEEFLKAEDDYAELEKLRAERDGLPDKLAQKQKERDKKKQERREKRTARDNAEEALEEAETAKSRQEQDLSRSVGGLVSESLNDFLGAEVDARIELDRQISAEKIAQSNDADEKRILTELDWRFEEMVDIWGIRNRRIGLVNNEKVIKAEWKELITDGRAGVVAKVRAMAKDAYAISPTDKGAVKAGKQAEIDRIDRRFAEEPEFVDKMTKEYIARLIAKQRQIGKVSEDDLLLIEKHGLKDAIDIVIANDPVAKQKVAEAVGQSESNDPSYVENAKKKYGESWAKILMGLLTTGLVISSLAKG
jgi:hypothetical protein